VRLVISFECSAFIDVSIDWRLDWRASTSLVCAVLLGRQVRTRLDDLRQGLGAHRSCSIVVSYSLRSDESSLEWSALASFLAVSSVLVSSRA
jgi:hypothetical protein